MACDLSLETNVLTERVFRYAQETWQPPFPQTLPSSVDNYTKRLSVWAVARRRASRSLNFLFHGQNHLERDRIDPSVHRRVLWIHHGMPQVGDSLTDLAARELLHGKVDRLDLLTDPHLLQLYRSDRVFTNIGATAAELPGPYDLVLLHSASSRSVKEKFAHYRQVPFAHIYGYYTGPELNRTLFGYYRMVQLLGLPLSEDEVQRMACPSMWASMEEEDKVERLQIPHDAIVVAVGGVRDWCTYLQWPQVLQGLHARGLRRPVVLVGSDNGKSMRDQIMAANPGLTIIDRIAQHSLGEVHAIMRRGAMVVCSDGGLLHVAHTARVPVVTLFAGISEPHFRLTAANRTTWLYGTEWVNDVPAADLVDRILEAIGDRSPNRPAQTGPR